jgi:hypothetical protein
VKLTGSRATLFANVGALVLACAVFVEVVVIENARFGHVLPSDPFLCFFPVMVMFVVRSEPFSFAFLLAHFLISLRLFFTVHDVLAGVHRFSRANDPLFMLTLFEMATVVCLVVYVASTLIKSVVSSFSKQ